ncbi:MAG: quinolinate synthase NadA [Nitrososphaeria archaeon]
MSSESLRLMEELSSRVRQLKEELSAVILAHNYQRSEVQDIADFLGDSLDLSRKATQTRAEIIVFCGVDFMAESAAILNPTKTVLLPELNAACPMAAMITPKDVRVLREKHPGAPVVCYVNSSAAVKAESDICCTSVNAVKIVNSLPEEKIIFIPDEYLGRYVASKSKKDIILHPGFCPTHARLKADEIRFLKEVFPDAEIMVHPECTPEVIALADAVLSTSQMVRHAKESSAKAFIVGTEEGLLYRLRRENPGKTFHLASSTLICPNMKKITLESVTTSLEKSQHVVMVPEKTRRAAARALDRMLAVK